MILNVITLGNELLRKKSEQVTEINDEIRQLIQDMYETMYASEGVGLAGVQIAKLLRIFVIDDREGHKAAFINPQIISTSAETCEYDEGCLSIPGVYETITRPKKITIQALNEKGKPFTLNAEGFLARIIQHEFDHLEGFLYIDRGDEEFKQKTVDKFEKKIKRKAEKEKAKAAKEAKIASKIAAKKAKKEMSGSC
ncbi:MAG: peptide deformylase [Treponemataceae bacterium]